jgi:hypothetical protein
MRNLYARRGGLCAVALVALIAAGCGGGGSEKEYVLAGRVVNGNPYSRGTMEPRPGTKVLIKRSAETVTIPSGTYERYEFYTEMIADANGNFSLRVPEGRYFVTTVPPPGGNPNDGVETPDDVCASREILLFPPREDTPQGAGEELILGHDFCRLLPVYE